MDYFIIGYKSNPPQYKTAGIVTQSYNKLILPNNFYEWAGF